MEETSVIILLHISEATGLNLRNGNVLLTASLGGNMISSEVVPSSKNTIFDLNLIWKTDKKAIKRMKTENLPIKLECFCLLASSRRELIGFIMIPIRGIQIVFGSRLGKVRPKWHKLIGISTEWKQQKPEISFYTTITEAGNEQMVTPVRMELNATVSMLSSQQGIYVNLVEDEQYIQVGDSPEDCHLFMVNVMLRSITGLQHKPVESASSYHLYYVLLGNAFDDRTLTYETDGIYAIQEKITIRFRSSLLQLQNYFKRVFYIPIELYRHSAFIGSTKLSLASSLPIIDSLEEFFNIPDYTIQATGKCPLHIDQPNNLPTIEYEVSLKLILPKSPKVVLDEPLPISEVNKLGEGDGDGPLRQDDIAIDLNIDLDSPAEEESGDEIDAKWEPLPSPKPQMTPCSANCLFLSDLNEVLKTPCSATKAIPRTFSYKLMLQEIAFNQIPEAGAWQISLHHSKAHNPLTRLNISLKNPKISNQHIELYFTADAQYINDLIESEPCVLTVKGPRGALATAEIDNATLLAQQQNVGIILLENEATERVAMAHASLQLIDLGTNFNRQKNDTFGLTSGRKHPLDTDMAYKMFEELEDWKGQQQDIFLADLKRRESEHLTKLTTEWRQRRSDLESTLLHKLEQCNTLTTALEEAKKAVKEQSMEDMERQRAFEAAKTDMDRTYSRKVLTLYEKTRRCEDDTAQQLRLADQRNKNLECRLEALQKQFNRLEAENITLRNEIKQVTEQMPPPGLLNEADEKLKLLEEKLQAMQNSKIFYKEQWAKVVREMHKLKGGSCSQTSLSNEA